MTTDDRPAPTCTCGHIDREHGRDQLGYIFCLVEGCNCGTFERVPS